MGTVDSVRAPLLCAVLLLAVGCAAGAAGPGAKSADGSDPVPGESEGTASSGPQLPSCDDGSCFPCGDTICLPGYYCESTGENTGCAWSGKCAEKASCACLASQLANDPACRCEERDGHAFVTCEP